MELETTLMSIKGQLTNSNKAIVGKFISIATINEIKTRKGCPFEKVTACMLPPWPQEHSPSSEAAIINLWKEILDKYDEIVLYLDTEDEGTIPNQTLLALLMRLVSKCSKSGQIRLISSERNILMMIRYEVMKAENWQGTFEWDLNSLY